MLRYINGKEDYKGERINGVSLSKKIEKNSDEELAAFGLERYEKPEVEPEPSPPRKVGDFIEFMGLFTSGERTKIAGAAMSLVPIKLWYDQAVATNRIDLESEKVSEGITALAGAGLIDQVRVDEILAKDFDQ